MNTLSPPSLHTIKNKLVNWPPVDALLRDQSQSQLLHEPKYRINTTDSMTGHDIEDVVNHPSMVDGNLTLYFETDVSRKAYQDLPLNHPSLHLPYPATDEDDRGG